MSNITKKAKIILSTSFAAIHHSLNRQAQAEFGGGSVLHSWCQRKVLLRSDHIWQTLRAGKKRLYLRNLRVHRNRFSLVKVKTPFVNLDTEQDKVESPRAIPVPVFRDLKACAPRVKLSPLQRRILRAALEGVSRRKNALFLSGSLLMGRPKSWACPMG